MIFMNAKLINVIFLFSLILILSTSAVFAEDNSTDLNYSSENHSISDAKNISDDFNFDIGEWSLDENGNIVNIPSNKSHGDNDFSVDFQGNNVTDLRNNASGANPAQDDYSILKPSGFDSWWEEFVKDPAAFMDKYNPQPKAPPVNFVDDVQNGTCDGKNSKEFTDFINFVKKTRVTPDSIIGKDVNVFYSTKNVYWVRVLNPVGDSVGKGIKVTFIFNGKKIMTQTNENGYASFKFKAQSGKYVVKAYAGNVTSKHKVTVKPLFKTKDVSKKYKKSSKFTVRLVKINGKSLQKKNIKITLKGKTYTVKTNSKGIATFNIPKNLKVGKYTIKTSYNGCVVKNCLTVKR